MVRGDQEIVVLQRGKKRSERKQKKKWKLVCLVVVVFPVALLDGERQKSYGERDLRQSKVKFMGIAA